MTQTCQKTRLCSFALPASCAKTYAYTVYETCWRQDGLRASAHRLQTGTSYALMPYARACLRGHIPACTHAGYLNLTDPKRVRLVLWSLKTRDHVLWSLKKRDHVLWSLKILRDHKVSQRETTRSLPRGLSETTSCGLCSLVVSLASAGLDG